MVGLSAFEGSDDTTENFLVRWRETPDVDTWIEEEKGQEQPPFPYEVMARGGLQWLEDEYKGGNLDPGAGEDLLRLLDTFHPSLNQIDFSEVHSLRRLQQVPESARSQVPQALLLRLSAERAALPADTRAHYWIQSQVNEADQARRYAEDHLFVGNDAELARSERLSSRAIVRYDQADEHSARIGRAYNARDMAYAWLPYLTEWTLRRARFDPKSVAASDLDELGALAGKVHALGESLDTDFDPRRPRTIIDAATVNDIEARLGELTQQFSEWWGVWDSVVDTSAVGPCQLLLETPLTGQGEDDVIPGFRRNGLREELLETIFDEYQQDDTTDAVADAESGSQSEREDVPDHLFELLLKTNQHPLLSILTPPAGGSARGSVELRGDTPLDRIRYVSAAGQRVRDLLDQVSRVVLPEPGDEHRHSGRRVRLPAARADRRERAAMALLGPTKVLSLGATMRLGQLDRHFLRLWHGNRMLDGFWAGYYEPAAEQLLASPERFMYYGSDHVRDKLDRLTRIVDQKRVVPPQCASLAKVVNDEAYQISVALKESPHVPSGLAVVSCQPIGTFREIPFAALSQRGERFDRRGMPVSLIAEGASGPQQFEVRASDVGSLDRIAARSWFRGHQGRVRIALPHIGPGQQLVSIERESPPPASVTVYPTTKRLERIVLILDASYSMTEPFGGEGNRWGAALSAVNKLLHTLERLPESNYELALIVYGHRAGWRSSESSIVVYSPSYQREIDGRGATEIHPNQDVELILFGQSDFTTLTENSVRSLNDRLRDRDEFAPRGMTPLHYAISRAIDKLGDQATPAIPVENRIILVTDGKNEIIQDAFDSEDFRAVRNELEQHYRQFKPEAPIVKRIRDLRRSQAMDLTIDVIGVDYNNRIDLDKEANYTNASNAKELLHELERSAGLYSFELHHRDRRLGEALVANPIVVNQPDATRTQYSVSLGTNSDVTPHPIELRGGEKIELYHNSTLQRLEHRLYDPKGAEKGECYDHYVSALYPIRDNNRVDFRVTIQNNDEHLFSPRPIGFWATVKPTGGALGVYHFSDMRFVAETPVPVLELTVPNWPRGIRRAEISCWFRFQEDIESHSESVRRGKQFRVGDLPEVSFRMDIRGADNGIILVVEETSQSGVEGLQLARVVAKPSPDVVSRTMFAERNKLVHEFHYRGLREPTSVEVTPLAQIKRHYAHLVSPIQVTLQD